MILGKFKINIWTSTWYFVGILIGIVVGMSFPFTPAKEKIYVNDLHDGMNCIEFHPQGKLYLKLDLPQNIPSDLHPAKIYKVYDCVDF